LGNDEVAPPNPERVLELVIDSLQYRWIRLRTLSEFGDLFRRDVPGRFPGLIIRERVPPFKFVLSQVCHSVIRDRAPYS